VSPVKITDVAVAVFLKPDGSVLLSSRPAGKPYAGYWEFPGGKIEAGETVRDALKRELIEELNVVIDVAAPWFTFMMHYEHATVRLHTWRVTGWHDVDARGIRGMEGQEWKWQTMSNFTVAPTLPGCGPILRALSLPSIYALTNAAEVGTETYLQQLRAVWSKIASKRPPDGEFDLKNRPSPMMIQVREKSLSPIALKKFAVEVVAIAREHHALVLINGDANLAAAVGADGVHLTSAQLRTTTERPPFQWVGASVHSQDELRLAAELKCDFAILGSVKTTQSHQGQPPIGWDVFADIVRDTPIPVFAIGGLGHADLSQAIARGAHGIAMQRQSLMKS